jgi:arylsulfate sulfotransferase
MRAVILAVLFSGGLSAANLKVAVQLAALSPQPAGTNVILNFSATDTNPNPGVLNFKLEVQSPLSANYVTVHDFEISPSFNWAQNLIEGSYHLRVTARDSNYPGVYSEIVIPYTILPRATSTQYVVSDTNHPLVALFSAPACHTGTSMRVAFIPTGSTQSPYYTNFRKCSGTKTMNLLIGGLIAATEYNMTAQYTINGQSPTNGPTMTWTSGSIPAGFPGAKIANPIPFGSSASPERITLLSFNGNATPEAVDRAGHIVWFYNGSGTFAFPSPANVQIDRLLPGEMLTVTGYPGGYTGTGLWGNPTAAFVVQSIDLAGNVIQETNVDRINEQLTALGATPLTTVNHDIRRLPNGNTIVIGSTQAIFPAGTQGSTVPVDILGDEFIELDTNFQVVWHWDAFDHDGGNGQLDINRPDPLGETCTTANEGTDGCPPVLLGSPANDWLHANAIQYEPDGNLIVSFRNQDWIAKIDFENGTGTGNILWLMGLDGNFQIISSDPYPWFSHQHDVEFQDSNYTGLSMFDNGNTRIAANGGYSRAYLATVNESALTVTPTLLAPTGQFAVAMGSAQPLSNGDWEFMGGDIVGQPPSPGENANVNQWELGQEVNAAGTAVYTEQAPATCYRIWRLTDFYNVPAN